MRFTWARVVALLKIDNLTAGYGEGLVLCDLSLNVDAGEVVAVVGRNGAGKSTLIKSIMGQTQIQSGAIWLNENVELSALRPHQIPRRGVSAIGQGNRVFAELTVQENLRLASHRVVPPETIKHTLKTQFPQLLNKRIQLAGTLSGGEQQMLALATLYIAEAQCILLDEPTEGLMPSLVEAVRQQILSLKEEQKALLLAEANLEFILSCGDRYCLLDQGRIIGQGTITDEARPVLERHLGIGLQ